MRSVVLRIGRHQQIGTVCIGDTCRGITCTSVTERLLVGTAAHGIGSPRAGMIGLVGHAAAARALVGEPGGAAAGRSDTGFGQAVERAAWAGVEFDGERHGLVGNPRAAAFAGVDARIAVHQDPCRWGSWVSLGIRVMSRWSASTLIWTRL